MWISPGHRKTYFLDFDGESKYSRNLRWPFDGWQWANHRISRHKLVTATAIKEPWPLLRVIYQATTHARRHIAALLYFHFEWKIPRPTFLRVAVFAECKPGSVGGKNWLSTKRSNTWLIASGASSLWTHITDRCIRNTSISPIRHLSYVQTF